MVYSLNFCSITPNIWRAQKNIVSIGENENGVLMKGAMLIKILSTIFLTDN